MSVPFLLGNFNERQGESADLERVAKRRARMNYSDDRSELHAAPACLRKCLDHEYNPPSGGTVCTRHLTKKLPRIYTGVGILPYSLRVSPPFRSYHELQPWMQIPNSRKIGIISSLC